MNLSAQDHQTFFNCELDTGKADYEMMSTAWREVRYDALTHMFKDFQKTNKTYGQLCLKKFSNRTIQKKT